MISLWISSFLFISGVSVKGDYLIGGIFNEDVHHAAFQVIVDDLNEENFDLPFEITTDLHNVSYDNILEAKKATCSILKKGIIGIFGPSSTHTSNYIQSICDNKEMPHIETHYDSKIQRNRVVNLHPYPGQIAKFFIHLIVAYQWDRVIILFEDDDSLLRLSPLLELNIEYGIHLLFRQLDKDSSGSYREVFNNIKLTDDSNILLDCSVEVLEEVLTQAQQVGLLTDKYKYIITNLDFVIINYEPFQYGGANITGVRLFDPESEEAIDINNKILEKMKVPEEEWTETKMGLSTALLVDGVKLFYEVIKDLLSIRNEIFVENLGCASSDSWRFGYTLANLLKTREFYGLTGKVSFDFEGFRKNFVIDVVEINKDGLSKIAEWNTTSKVLDIIRRDKIEPSAEDTEENMFNRTFRVIIALTQPYAMLKETSEQMTGNDRFEGFCIDVIEELSLELGFTYILIVQEDGKNGNLNKNTGQWDGMIRQIIDEHADLAITDLTITSERESAVDFTMPFMNLGISILYKKPAPQPPSLFLFTSPFTRNVWIMLGVAYTFVSISIFIMGRMSPSEWNNPYPCLEEPEHLVNQFSFRNSLWFTIGALLQQGSEIAPISISTRTASGVWWFFVLIMVSSYTANLAAFLTVTANISPIKSIDDLARQSVIKYGAKKGGATENFFRPDSNTSTHRTVYKYLKEHPEYMTQENDQGVKRAEEDEYAFLMESTSIEYTVQRHCSLGQVGGLLDDKGYGIAIKKNSEYRNDLSTAILKLQETGKITKFKMTWWKEKRNGSACGIKREPEAEPLTLANVGGVFLVLFVGAILALFGSFLEMACLIYSKCKRTNTPFKQELKKELSFFIQFNRNEKEVSVDE